MKYKDIRSHKKIHKNFNIEFYSIENSINKAAEDFRV